MIEHADFFIRATVLLSRWILLIIQNILGNNSLEWRCWVKEFSKILKSEEEQKVLLYTNKNKVSQLSNLKPKLLAHDEEKCSVIIVS